MSSFLTNIDDGAMIEARLPTVLRSNTMQKIYFFMAILSGIACLVASVLHYTGRYPGNPVTWAGWLSSMVFLLLAYYPRAQETRLWLRSIKGLPVLALLILAVFFVSTHYWNYSTAPWNHNGLFDDAAWDIYFAKKNILSDAPFQAMYYEDTSRISKETSFHYYISVFFKLFGFNLITFNIALTILGLTTVVFTTLLVHRMFNMMPVTVATAVIMNFLPTHFIQTFVGHRYAIAAPLIMASLYFLYTGFQNRSGFRMALSAILAALAVSGATMGKHYVFGLVIAMGLYLLFDLKSAVTPNKRNLAIIFGIGLVLALIPFLVNIYFDYENYVRNERSLTQTFLAAYNNSGLSGIKQAYFDRLFNIFLSTQNGGERLWTNDQVLVPFAYYLFLIPGIYFALKKKRFEILVLAFLPVAGAFVAGAYDFRMLHATPFWVILIAFTLQALIQRHRTSTSPVLIQSRILLVLPFIVLAFGLIPSINYVYAKSKDPFSIHLFAHREVATSRLLRDLVAGAPAPSASISRNEFSKRADIPEPDFETYACVDYGFAIPHLYLQDYNALKILSFCGNLYIAILPEPELIELNKKAILSHKDGGKDLKLIWEVSPKGQQIIEKFKQFNGLGREELYDQIHEGRSYSFYILTIPNQNIEQFKQAVSQISVN